MSLATTIKWRVSILTPKALPQPNGQSQGIEIEAKVPGSCLSPGPGLGLARALHSARVRGVGVGWGALELY